MLKDFNRNTIVFSNADVAIKFITNSLIARRLPLETFTVDENSVTVVYATWDVLTEDEKLDVLFYPDVVSKTFDVSHTNYGKKVA